MTMTMSEWLAKEEAVSTEAWGEAIDMLKDPNATETQLAKARKDADYWGGYCDAIVNAQNELGGMTRD